MQTMVTFKHYLISLHAPAARLQSHAVASQAGELEGLSAIKLPATAACDEAPTQPCVVQPQEAVCTTTADVASAGQAQHQPLTTDPLEADLPLPPHQHVRPHDLQLQHRSGNIPPWGPPHAGPGRSPHSGFAGGLMVYAPPLNSYPSGELQTPPSPLMGSPVNTPTGVHCCSPLGCLP